MRVRTLLSAAVLIVFAQSIATAQSDGTTPLHWAVHNNDVNAVDRLIKSGAGVNAKNDYGATPMSEAAAAGSEVIIERLLKAGADPNVPHADGQTALMVIARGTNVKAAKLLIDHRANVNAAEQQKKQTALMWAAAQGQAEMVKLLIASGADVNARALVNVTASAMYAPTNATPLDWPSNVSTEPRAGYRAAGGFTPLLYAAREGCMLCAKYLIDGGANIDMHDPEGITPLIMAVHNMRFDTAAYLIKAGADVNKWDWWGRSPLYLAADVNTIPRGGRPDQPSLDETTSMQIIEMLLDAGANPNLQLKLLPPYRNVGADRGVDGMLTIGATPLLRAAKALDAPAIALMLKKGALPNLPNIRGTTPVMAAAGLGSVDADTRGVFTTEDTPQRSIASLKLLLDAGGDINLKDNIRGSTPLHGAAFWGWNDTVKFLVERGADLNAKDNRGMTPIDSALGKAGGNSRGGQRIDVHEDTADLLRKLTAAQ